MNSVLIRLIIVKNNKEYNVLFDKSFSLSDNLKLLSNITGDSYDSCFVYDGKLNLFLNKSKSLESYNIPSSRVLHIY